MEKEFYKRLIDYFGKIAEVLKGEAAVSSIFPNTSDIGQNREKIYLEFLKQHSPSKCNIFFGGFLFGEDGDESNQIDVIITTDIAPRYNFFNEDERGKSFASIEGCLGVASIKSNLDKEQLFNSIEGFANLPKKQPIGKKINPSFSLDNYDDWPYKIIYASDGISCNTILKHLYEFYSENSHIPLINRPNMIHVAGKYMIIKFEEYMSFRSSDGSTIKQIPGNFYLFETNPDLQAMIWVINSLQKKATASNHILFDYSKIINKIIEIL